MFKCNNCHAEFERYDTIRESSGEKWYVCPFCRGDDFDEMRAKNDAFFEVKKETVIDSVVTAITALNGGDIKEARTILSELISDLVGCDLFEFKSCLETVTDSGKDKLIKQLCTVLEVVRV